MRTTWVVAALLAASPAISYFKFDRQIGTTAVSGQHYAAVEENIWQHALPNLDDLRIYAAGKEIPYVVRTMRGNKETEQKTIRILQPATLGSKTQFLLDMSEASEYDRITLTLKTKNYVAHARVEGQDDSHARQWANLATTTLFDLSDEKLGHNGTLQIPVSTYKYLRVTIDGLIKPGDVQSATAGIERAQEAVWRELSSEPNMTQEGKDTVLTFMVPENVPVDRLILTIDPAQGNFQREIELLNEKGMTTGTGEIARIHLQRNGGKIDLEHLWLPVNTTSQGQLRAVIHNRDDAPLRVASARLQQYERRVYFDCDAGISPALYYGDDKLNAPMYDYVRLFQSDARAEHLLFGAEAANAIYTGRPDDRPWSERHPAVLWTAILAAVAVLGGIAVRSIKNAAA
jgi:hypothetical protein